MAKKLSKVVKTTYRCSYKACTTFVDSYGGRCGKHRHLW